MEPDSPTIEGQAGDVCQRTGTEATGLRQMDGIAQTTALPLVRERLNRDRGIPSLGLAATAAAEAVGQVSAPLHDIDRSPVRADHPSTEQLTHWGLLPSVKSRM
jgi:hypothetical protein